MKCLLKNFPLCPLGCFSFSSSCPASTFSPSFWQPFLPEKKEHPMRPKWGSLNRLGKGKVGEGKRLCCFLGSESHGQRTRRNIKAGEKKWSRKSLSRRLEHVPSFPRCSLWKGLNATQSGSLRGPQATASVHPAKLDTAEHSASPG